MATSPITKPRRLGRSETLSSSPLLELTLVGVGDGFGAGRPSTPGGGVFGNLGCEGDEGVAGTAAPGRIGGCGVSDSNAPSGWVSTLRVLRRPSSRAQRSAEARAWT